MAKQAVTKTEVRDLAMPESNPFETYGSSISVSNITGKLLKFNKGDWLAGEDDEDVEPGTKLVANMDQLLIGWQKWEDNKPTDRAMGLLVEAFKAPPRSTLGDTDEDHWEVDESGKARDPWQFTNYLIMKTPGKKAVSDELYTFTTSSKGGLNCVGMLCKEYGKEMRNRPDDYPVVELGVSSYDHPKYGKTKIPTFKLVGWEKKSLFDSSATAANGKKK